jgi:hypothetical protein
MFLIVNILSSSVICSFIILSDRMHSLTFLKNVIFTDCNLLYLSSKPKLQFHKIE